MEQTIQERQAIERRIVERVIDAMLAAGYTLGVNDGQETTIRRSTDKAAVLAAMFTTDEESLTVYPAATATVTKPKPIGWVFLVYGNEPGWDVLCDHSTNLEPQIEPIMEWIEQQQAIAINAQMREDLRTWSAKK